MSEAVDGIEMFNGILFQESLQDLVKGIRANRRNEAEYMRRRVADIGDECRTSDMEKKAVAVLKLTYLQMMGHSINFSSFYITEVMSSPIFATKRIGYLAAAQSFSPTTDVLLLTTNQFKKDLTNGKVQDCSQALTCLGKLITEELGRDLEHDIVMLLSSPRPYIRKKALLVLYRLILVHPETLAVVSIKLREMLGDSDPSVVCAAVTVICELAKASPRNFLALAPVFYQLLTSPASNNWMLIKIVKLMGVLTPQEPRLGRKLVEPLVSLMRTTRAKSLLYECCSTITSGLLAHPEAVELCAQQLGKFMVDPDQNLKYLGLLSMRKLIKVHPDVAMEHRDLVLDCLDDDDVGIRMRALEIVAEYLNRRNYRDLCRILLRKLRKASDDAANIINTPALDSVSSNATDEGKGAIDVVVDEEAPYRDSLARQLLRPGEYIRDIDGRGTGGYEMLNTTDDFLWYLSTVLNGLATTDHLSHAISTAIAEQMMELTSRVFAVRETSVKVALSLFESPKNSDNLEAESSSTSQDANGDILNDSEYKDENERTSSRNMHVRRTLPLPLISSASWIVGEYAELVVDHISALKTLVSYDVGGSSAAQVSFLSSILKIYALCAKTASSEAFKFASSYINSRITSDFAEVQDRAWLFSNLLGHTDNDADKRELQALFEGKLKPVDVRAQSVIPVPDGLDLSKPLIDTKGESLCKYLIRKVPNAIASSETDGVELFEESEYNTGNTHERAVSSSKTGSNRRTESPFFLGTERKETAVVDSTSRSIVTMTDGFSSENPSHGKTAILVPDEVPDGVDLSKITDGVANTATVLDTNKVPSFRGEVKKSKKRGKKKKARNGKETTEKMGSLIDFAEPPTQQAATSTPKHLAESEDLLL